MREMPSFMRGAPKFSSRPRFIIVSFKHVRTCFFSGPGQSVQRFQFEDDEILDDQIGPEPFVEMEVVVLKRDRHFAKDTQPQLGEFLLEDLSANRFEQPRSQPHVDAVARVDHDL